MKSLIVFKPNHQAQCLLDLKQKALITKDLYRRVSPEMPFYSVTSSGLNTDFRSDLFRTIYQSGRKSYRRNISFLGFRPAGWPPFRIMSPAPALGDGRPMAFQAFLPPAQIWLTCMFLGA